MRHILNIYQKPAQGTSFIRRFLAYNYRHKISAIGGFDTASCDIAVPIGEAHQFLEQFIGNRIAVFVDNPTEPIWEGFINRMTFSAGSYQYSISLDEMVNRAQTIYTNTSTAAPVQSAVANDTDSQAAYGIKAGRVEMGPQANATAGTAGAVTALRDTVLQQNAWPKASISQGGGGGLVSLEMLGFWHTLAWDNWNDTTNALAQATTLINTVILPGVANGTTFFDNADTRDVDTNTTTMLRLRTRGQTMQEVLSEIAEVGDGTNRHVIGITPTSPNLMTRRLYYRAFNATVEYTARRSDGLRIRNLFGKLERPWAVQPDRGVRITDLLPGWNGLGDDPRETWISVVDYDANQQTVSWSGDDNITAEGAFQLRRYNKIHGTRFGPDRRIM